MKFEFASASRIVFGPGLLREAGALAREVGERALVVIGHDRRRAKELLEVLEAAGVRPVTYPVAGEPAIKTVQVGAELGRAEHCELVVGFGGGSVIDTGKAIAAMLANPGELLDYLEIVGRGKALRHPSVPFVAIPTTAGTGSEATRNAVLAVPEQRLKVSLRSPHMLPRVALVDPELTYGLPPMLTATTGLDALTQLIEPFVCLLANPMTDALCREGIRRAARSLAPAVREPLNAAAREDLALASLLSGLALANAGLGAVHGLAGPIGGMFPAPHGAVCAALLPHVMEANIRALQARPDPGEALRRYHEVARLLTGKPEALAPDGIDWIRTLVRDLQIPGLGAYHLTSGDLPAVSQRALKASSMKPNPVPLSAEALQAILQAAL
jgi:alcohol dehydrogenase class IV